MGPTASGKTDLACALSDRFPLELVSVDSAMVYTGMDVGTAKPDQATLARYPHALVDIRDPANPYSAAEFRTDACAVMQGISDGGRIPLLVGGTGLYFRALQQGLSDLPEADPTIRAGLSEEGARIGWPAMHARLLQLDPEAANRIGCNDAQRLQRALEVIELTGRRLSELQRSSTASRFPWRVLKLALLPPDRQLLRVRIEQRFDSMLRTGLLDEVISLRERGDLHADLPSIRAVGYRQAWEHLDGDTTFEEFRQRAIFATRQLAKRQMTWLRSELDARVLDPGRSGLLDEAIIAVRGFLDGIQANDAQA